MVVCGWEGWWLPSGGSHNTGTLGSILDNCWLFYFPVFHLIVHRILVNSHRILVNSHRILVIYCSEHEAIVLALHCQ